ncbi:MAG: Serine-protein kinase RsbW [Chlamydiales bacterium]|nr:Serine-protein kinase RsbW [Chlamydiales bacterium]
MEFKASVDSLAGVMEFIRKQAEANGIEHALIQKMELACEEAIVNIISYAYKKKPGVISVTCEKKGKRFEITLCDQGIAFNPIDVEINPQFGTPVLQRKVGGMGIFLIRKVIDDVSYQRVGKENVLRLAFNLL